MADLLQHKTVQDVSPFPHETDRESSGPTQYGAQQLGALWYAGGTRYCLSVCDSCHITLSGCLSRHETDRRRLALFLILCSRFLSIRATVSPVSLFLLYSLLSYPVRHSSVSNGCL